VTAPVLRDELGISNFGYARMVFSFLLDYTLLQPVTGWLIDWIGTRRGFAIIIMAWWSIAAVLHAFARGILSFSVLRFLLGAGEASGFAASVRATSEWLPSQERGLANGIWGAGTSAGLIISVPVVAWLTLRFGWRSAFIVVGLTGFVWIAARLALYRPPDQHPALDARELAHNPVGRDARARGDGRILFGSAAVTTGARPVRRPHVRRPRRVVLQRVGP
jgi:ACS family hexuronate transporter-like MFS transporter